MLSLLEKTRLLNRFIQRSPQRPEPFMELAEMLGDISNASVYIIGRRKILGYYERLDLVGLVIYGRDLETRQVEQDFQDWLFSFNQTDHNIKGEDGLTYTVVPVFGGGERQGTILLVKKGQEEFNAQDLILYEYAATVVGLEILRLNSEKMEEEARKKAAVRLALDALSYSELEAVKKIFSELDGVEGFVVASKLAEQYHLTRSVIVNALRKLESAGVIDSRSLGMKGTYIRILNDYFLDKLEIAQQN
ncbi:transcriptional pleiotropic repressor [Carboxydothermus ferrireducens DSM 11255]|uniref:Global transcriptional regulator CodY n=1 Tax=Carboxydothermus ferrireducens DSM 11255 TaxID=1119529 RepID=A0ABX2R932_9THEO|nr:transcriptional pleiotropic repressor [Carboxydothermus ferrireducens DSM 11255]